MTPPGARPARLFVIFGLPGAGKTFVARRFGARGFHVLDGDDDLPSDMRAAIERARPVTPEMRERFMTALRTHVAALWVEHPRLVVAQTFLKQVHRAEFARHFPDATFVLVTASAPERAARLARRPAQRLDAAYVHKMIEAFDPPVAPFVCIANTGVAEALERAVDALVASHA
jgi:gluconate kinase